MVDTIKNLKDEVNVALVGKYTALHDAYISVVESLKHGGFANKTAVNIKWINSEELTPENVDEQFSDVSGILVPGGFGTRGINGKIKAKDIASHFKISLNTANNWIKEWLENGFLVRENDKQIRNVDYILTKKYQEKIK